ncbi:MAG TPA: erythromycin esterase family protein [Trueperaceae bacterium]|nr:erythromycin esterase family protein [Trueperaceae bacterium]
MALGEATHGAHEFFELKHRIIRYLVESHGFTVIAFEANMPESRAVDEYISGGPGDAAEALGGLFQVWNTREVLGLVEWLRQHNASATVPVEFHGFDIQSSGAAARVVLDFLEHFDADFLATAQDLYQPALELGREPNASRFLRLAPSLLRGGRVVLDHLSAGRKAYAANAPETETEWAVRNALLVVQMGEHAYDNLNSRDRSMADNVLWLLERDPDARIILWAHNIHVTEARDVGYGVETRMGARLAAAIGDSYRSIGFVFAQGNRALDSSPRTPTEHALPVAPTTLGGQFHEVGEPLFFLDLGRLGDSPGGAWLKVKQRFRWLGWAAQARRPCA